MTAAAAVLAYATAAAAPYSMSSGWATTARPRSQSSGTKGSVGGIRPR